MATVPGLDQRWAVGEKGGYVFPPILLGDNATGGHGSDVFEMFVKQLSEVGATDFLRPDLHRRRLLGRPRRPGRELDEHRAGYPLRVAGLPARLLGPVQPDRRTLSRLADRHLLRVVLPQWVEAGNPVGQDVVDELKN